MLRQFNFAQKSKQLYFFSRGISAIQNTGKKPPTLEEFDPLNPGDWQIGAGGKILPRLPEGTRCGRLVMGKYGLYCPKLRKRVEAYSAGLAAGLKSEEATPFDARLSLFVKITGLFCFLFGLHNYASITAGRVLWPVNYLVDEKK